MAGWETLPAELRIAIWHHAKFDGKEALPVAALAAVNQEWQSFFETCNFEALTIQQDDVADFGRTIQEHGRLGHLRHLRLHLSLPVYDCDQSETEEGLDSAVVHELTFTIAIVSLLDILATEEKRLSKNMQNTHPGLTLELSAASSSDGKHLFKDFRLSDDYEKLLRRYPNKPNESYIQHQTFEYEPSLAHTCTGDHEFNFRAFRRAHGYRPLELRIHNTTLAPKPQPVKMITGLLTRRQYHRSFSTSALSFLIRNCFPNLLSVRIERPQAARLNQHQASADAFLKEMLYCSLPRKLQSLHLFDDRSMPFQLHDEDYKPTTDSGVSEALWRVCHMYPELQNFSACSVIDATDFFSYWNAHSFVETNPWPELKTLCLTSRDLMPDPLNSSEGFVFQSERVVWKLLTDATEAAKLMPKLQVLELWHTQNERACVWTYYKTENRARIIVRGGLNRRKLHRQPNAIMRLTQMAKTWAQYATQVLHCKTTCEVLWLPGITLMSSFGWGGHLPYTPRDIVQHLELADTILHPTSLHQMRWESVHERHEGKLVSPKPIYAGENKPYDLWKEWEDLEADWHNSDPWGHVESAGADPEEQGDYVFSEW